MYFSEISSAGLPSAFALLMILFQNLNALYYWRAPREDYIDTHHFSWILWGLALLLAIVFELRGEPASVDERAGEDRVPWLRWLVAGTAVYAAILAASWFINGEKTMQSANTRFPIWSWRDEVPQQ